MGLVLVVDGILPRQRRHEIGYGSRTVTVGKNIFCWSGRVVIRWGNLGKRGKFSGSGFGCRWGASQVVTIPSDWLWPHVWGLSKVKATLVELWSWVGHLCDDDSGGIGLGRR
jgi:hypothetical protein